MVIADAESPGPTKKRPRLSLKYRGDDIKDSKQKKSEKKCALDASGKKNQEDKEINPMFEGNLQHDAQELLRCILTYLQDAEKELEKIKTSLPPRVLPQSSGPSNPIMQRFLSAAKHRSNRVIPVRSSPRKLDIKEEIQDGFSLKSQNRKGDFLEEIEQTEAAKTNVQELSAPAEGDTASVVHNECFNNSAGPQTTVTMATEESSGIDSAIISEKSRGGVKRRKQNLTLKSKKSNLSENGENAVPKLNGENEDNLCYNDKGSGDGSNIHVAQDEVDGMVKRRTVASQRNRRKGVIAMKKSSEEKVYDPQEVLDPSQRSILGMLKRQVQCKRLGMRGAVLRKNEGEKSERSEVVAMETQNDKNCSDEDDVSVDTEQIKAEEEQISRKAEQISSNAEQSPDVLSSVREEEATVMNSPRKMVLKLEKCDHVCDSPKKSVNANMATLALSPFKAGGAGRKDTGPLILNGPNSAKYKLDFSDTRRCNSVRVKALDSQLPLSADHQSNITDILPKRNKKDFVEKLFMGTMMLRTKCLECECSREKLEEFHDISVPVKKEENNESDDDDSDDDGDQDSCLKKLMDAFTEVELLKDDNKYYCDKCLHLVEAERSLHYEVLPDVLTLHLKRFSTSSGIYGYVSKINDHVSIPLALPCLRYKCPNPCSRPDHRYLLYAIVTHAGVTLTSGHYLAYVKVTGSHPPSYNQQLKISNSVTNQISQHNGSMNSTNQGQGQKSAIHTPGKEYMNNWIECDDETIRVYTESQFCGMLRGENEGSLLGTPYVLFYHRALSYR
ncbi:hypothetical protein FSP39_016033 [Pinctada imbricata]|uniref:USP domain-containing protein n=1 Tax=Pinctada imbricata TaxID=66713 RepID=A0AA89C2J2_PINIB|nr:hypothetical protein FSP39_016033 [Pinctada imbricata]